MHADHRRQACRVHEQNSAAELLAFRWHQVTVKTQYEDKRTAKRHPKGKYEMQRVINIYKSGSTQMLRSVPWEAVDSRTACISLIDWTSYTLSQGHTDWQSLVKCLDHRNIMSETGCSQAKLCQAARCTEVHWNASRRPSLQSQDITCFTCLCIQLEHQVEDYVLVQRQRSLPALDKSTLYRRCRLYDPCLAVLFCVELI